MSEWFVHSYSGFPSEQEAQDWLDRREMWFNQNVDREKFSIMTTIRKNYHGTFDAHIEAKDK